MEPTQRRSPASVASGSGARPDPDTDAMMRVSNGDLLAFESLVEKYKHPIINFLSRTLGDGCEAEDLAQTVFVQVFKSAKRYRCPAKFSTWLYTIARNLCLNEIRRRARHPADSMDRGGPDDDGHPTWQYADNRDFTGAEVLLQEELTQKLEEALAALPENQRTAILLLREEEMSYVEIAAVLGTSVSATKSLIHRGRETLKSRLTPYLRTGAWRVRLTNQMQALSAPARASY